MEKGRLAAAIGSDESYALLGEGDIDLFEYRVLVARIGIADIAEFEERGVGFHNRSQGKGDAGREQQEETEQG